MRMSAKNAAAQLQEQCRLIGLPVPVLEYKFHVTRRWKMDLAWTGANEPPLAVEVDGGVFMPGGGRHNRGAGYRSDCAKLNEAAIIGWHVMRVLPEQVASGEALKYVERFFATRGRHPTR